MYPQEKTKYTNTLEDGEDDLDTILIGFEDEF